MRIVYRLECINTKHNTCFRYEFEDYDGVIHYMKELEKHCDKFILTIIQK